MLQQYDKTEGRIPARENVVIFLFLVLPLIRIAMCLLKPVLANDRSWEPINLRP